MVQSGEMDVNHAIKCVYIFSKHFKKKTKKKLCHGQSGGRLAILCDITGSRPQRSEFSKVLIAIIIFGEFK